MPRFELPCSLIKVGMGKDDQHPIAAQITSTYHTLNKGNSLGTGVIGNGVSVVQRYCGTTENW